MRTVLNDAETFLLIRDIDISGRWKNLGYLVFIAADNIIAIYALYRLARAPRRMNRTFSLSLIGIIYFDINERTNLHFQSTKRPKKL
jgi:hypothetical protein